MKVAPTAILLALAAPAAFGQGVEPLSSPEEYGTHAKAGEITVAADYQFRTVELRGETCVLREGLAVEVALFGPKNKSFLVQGNQLRLRINGKHTLFPEHAGLVLSRETRGSVPHLDVVVNEGVIRIGGQEQTGRFPGEPGPPPPDRPTVDDRHHPQPTGKQPAEILRLAALPLGKTYLPVAGYLYYHYKKKTKSIKTLELLYWPDDGEVVVLKFK